MYRRQREGRRTSYVYDAIVHDARAALCVIEYCVGPRKGECVVADSDEDDDSGKHAF